MWPTEARDLRSPRAPREGPSLGPYRSRSKRPRAIPHRSRSSGGHGPTCRSPPSPTGALEATHFCEDEASRDGHRSRTRCLGAVSEPATEDGARILIEAPAVGQTPCCQSAGVVVTSRNRGECEPAHYGGRAARVVRVPSPSWPLAFAPQQYAAPALVSPHVWSYAAARTARASPPMTGRGVAPVAPPVPIGPSSSPGTSRSRPRQDSCRRCVPSNRRHPSRRGRTSAHGPS